jgi:hypothetical protein
MKISALVITIQLTASLVAPSASASSGRNPGPISSGYQSSGVTISDIDFTSVAQQIKDLSNPTFRAFLRLRILSWVPAGGSTERREAALAVASEGLSDLCANQNEIWPATAFWLYDGFTKSVKGLELPDTVSENCKLKKNDKASQPSRDLASAIKMLDDGATISTGTQLAKQAILSGQIPAPALLGQLLRLQTSNSPAWPELLSAVLFVEEQQPGALPLQMMGFFSPMFLRKSNPTEIQTRFLTVAVRATRLSPEDSSNPVIRGSIVELLSGILQPTRLLAPALYLEVASRLNSLSAGALNADLARQGSEERIRKSADPLEQTISEADITTDKFLKRQLLDRAARLAKEQGKLHQAIDLAVSGQDRNEADKYSPVDQFLGEVVQIAIGKKEPVLAAYAISKLVNPLNKANGLRLLGRLYAQLKDMVKSKEALTESAKLLKRADNNNDKVRASLSLAEIILAYDPSAGYDAINQVVDTINRLPSAEKDKEKLYSLSLLPVAEDLIRGFGLFAAQDGQSALLLAREIKLSELRVSALSGAYSVLRNTPSQQITKN